MLSYCNIIIIQFSIDLKITIHYDINVVVVKFIGGHYMHWTHKPTLDYYDFSACMSLALWLLYYIGACDQPNMSIMSQWQQEQEELFINSQWMMALLPPEEETVVVLISNDRKSVGGMGVTTTNWLHLNSVTM